MEGRNLAFLAAHFVLEGARLNPTGVDGLDIPSWKFGETEPKIFSDAEKAELKRRSDEVIERTRQSLFREP